MFGRFSNNNCDDDATNFFKLISKEKYIRKNLDVIFPPARNICTYVYKPASL